jgi:membrane protease YdiL (CAAX protease family)
MWLMALTFIAGLAFTWIFEKHRNLWAIGIVHGILGSVAYYLVIGQDPGAEILGWFGSD